MSPGLRPKKRGKQAKRLKIYKPISVELHECPASSLKAFLPRALRFFVFRPHEEAMKLKAGGVKVKLP